MDRIEFEDVSLPPQTAVPVEKFGFRHREERLTSSNRTLIVGDNSRLSLEV
jgi:hypothetical protein